jgi:hypothetical protein
VNRRGVAALGLALAATVALGCQTELPEATSPGATLYRTRCQGCHRLYQPGLMTAAMWRVQVERMQREFARRGMAQLSGSEIELLLAYLDAHSSDAAGAAERPATPAETRPTNGH